MASLPSVFGQVFGPLLWQQQLAMFGQTVTYYGANFAAGSGVALSVIWKEGRGTEDVSPGRYSHIIVCCADLTPPPVEGDIVEDSNGAVYDVVSVEIDAVGFALCILQEQGNG